MTLHADGLRANACLDCAGAFDGFLRPGKRASQVKGSVVRIDGGMIAIA